MLYNIKKKKNPSIDGTETVMMATVHIFKIKLLFHSIHHRSETHEKHKQETPLQNNEANQIQMKSWLFATNIPFYESNRRK